MEYSGYAESFRDLLVYQKARELARDVFALSSQFPKEEKFALTDQIRRSSRSIGAQIAEAWAKRRYEKHFMSKLTDADGEQQETQHWLEIAVDCKYLTQAEAQPLLEKCARVGRLLGGMIAKSELFCRKSNALRESEPQYLTNSEPITENGTPITDHRLQKTEHQHESHHPPGRFWHPHAAAHLEPGQAPAERGRQHHHRSSAQFDAPDYDGRSDFCGGLQG